MFTKHGDVIVFQKTGLLQSAETPSHEPVYQSNEISRRLAAHQLADGAEQ
jgi:hypothetical protein